MNPIDPPQMSDMHKIWTYVKYHPGQTAGVITHAVAAQGVPKQNISSCLTQQRARGILRSEGERPNTKWFASADEYLKRSPRTSEVSTTVEQQGNGLQTEENTLSAPPAPTKSKVYWTQEEIENLVTFWAFEHIRIGESLSEKGLRRVSMKEGYGFRPRKLQPLAAREFVDSHSVLLMAEVERLRKKAAQENTPAPPAQEEKPPQPSQEGTPFSSTSVPPSFGVTLDLALRFIIEERLAEFENRITSKMLTLLEGLPDYAKPVVPKRLPEVATPATDRKQQVIVINALGAQYESVKREFPQLDVRVTNDRLPSEQDPDLVVGMVKFMSHPLDNACKKKYGPRYERVNGASDSVKEMIRRRLQL